jgi:predicted nucleotide-binding protein (sugar kinase/HSP70/actin superfamily)
MAIYNNRIVSIIGPNKMANTPETINVQHTNGSTENVPVAQVYFTKEEKEALMKKHPSKFNDVKVTSNEDIEAVRAGVAPSFDPSYKEAAEARLQAEKQKELNDKNIEAAKKQAEKSANEVERTSVPMTAPVKTFNPKAV